MAADKDAKEARKRFNYVQIRLNEITKERQALLEERKSLGKLIKAAPK